MARCIKLSLITLFICSSILFFININNKLSKSFSIYQGLNCDTWKNFSYIDIRKYKTCLKWTRNDAFWSIQGIRHTAFKDLLNSSSLIIEIGGNTGLDTSKFIELYDPFIISFEPIISMSNDLIKKFKKNSKIEIQPYGLGNHARNLSIELFDADNTGTSIFRQISTKNSSKIQQIQLLDIISVIENIRKTKTRNGIIDMISINCEGCEFEILPALILHNITQYFRIIQFASHMDFLIDSSCIYCQIEQALERTHLIKYQYVMLWEAWVLKNR
jgi:FkbM family methyltransferase